MTTKRDPEGQGWFDIPGIHGMRTPIYQRKGLQIIGRHAYGKSVLDLGCAEGCISKWLLGCGASHAHGMDYSVTRIAAAKASIQTEGRGRFVVWDLNGGLPHALLDEAYDIILLLAILQKLRDPRRFLHAVLPLARDWVAIRAPYPVIRDRRSRYVEFDVREHMSVDFELVQESEGHPEDARKPDWDQPAWLGIFRRHAH